MKYLTPKRRRYLYRLAAAALGVAVVHGWLSGDESASWLLLIAAALGVADAHVSDGE